MSDISKHKVSPLFTKNSNIYYNKSSKQHRWNMGWNLFYKQYAYRYSQKENLDFTKDVFECNNFVEENKYYNSNLASNAEQISKDQEENLMDVSINTLSNNNTFNSDSSTDKINNNEKSLSPLSLKRTLEDADNNKENEKKKIKRNIISEDNVAKKKLVREISQEDIRNRIKTLTQEEIEALLLQKIVQNITVNKENGELLRQAKEYRKILNTQITKCQQLQKQVEGFDIVLKRIFHDKKLNNDKYECPMQIKRSVGLQVDLNAIERNYGLENYYNFLRKENNSPSSVSSSSSVSDENLEDSNSSPIVIDLLNTPETYPLPKIKRNLLLPKKLIDLNEENQENKIEEEQSTTNSLETDVYQPKSNNVELSTNSQPSSDQLPHDVTDKEKLLEIQEPKEIKYSEILNANKLMDNVDAEHDAQVKKDILPPFPAFTNIQEKPIPPKLNLKIKQENGKESTAISLMWNLKKNDEPLEGVRYYELFSYQKEKVGTSWVKIQELQALQLPMQCTLSLNKNLKGTFYFTVRAVNLHNQKGEFSAPENVVI